MTDFPHRFFHGRRTGKDSLKEKIVCSLKKSQWLAAGGFLFLLLPYEKSSASRICMRVAELIISQRKLFEFYSLGLSQK